MLVGSYEVQEADTLVFVSARDNRYDTIDLYEVLREGEKVEDMPDYQRLLDAQREVYVVPASALKRVGA